MWIQIITVEENIVDQHVKAFVVIILGTNMRQVEASTIIYLCNINQDFC